MAVVTGAGAGAGSNGARATVVDGADGVVALDVFIEVEEVPHAVAVSVSVPIRIFVKASKY